MTYDEWSESYFSGQLMNEAMARAAWDFAVLAEREECARLCNWLNGEKRLTPAGCDSAIRARGHQ